MEAERSGNGSDERRSELIGPPCEVLVQTFNWRIKGERTGTTQNEHGFQIGQEGTTGWNNEAGMQELTVKFLRVTEVVFGVWRTKATRLSILSICASSQGTKQL
jgi:hypothetical protein